MNSVTKRRWKIAYRIALWGITLAFPFIAWSREENFSIMDYVRYLSGIISFITIFYANHNYLIQRYLFRKQILLFIVLNILISAALMCISYMFHRILPEPRFIPRPEIVQEKMPLWRFLIGGTSFFVFVCVVSVASKMTGSWYIAEDKRKELERSRTEAELQNLKSQLNPHFLFNTLNNIYSMIEISPERAQDAVHELGQLLRYVLYESSEQIVAIGKEIDFVVSYVELMRIRLPRHAELKTDIQTDVPNTGIAPLLFITLIENAFKHGISGSQPSFINIRISISDRRIHCRIMNSFFPKTQADQSGSGIGIANLQKRLSLLYPEKHKFEYGLNNNNTYISDLEIDL
jgi:sensor histidine kinase YesM